MKSVFAVPVMAVLAAIPLAAPALSAQTQSSAISCSRLNVNGTKPNELIVTVNGAVVGTYYGSDGVYQDLERRMQPGVNRVGLRFASPGDPDLFGTSAELRCLAPGVQSSRDTILTLKPTPKRLSAEIDVNYVPK